MHQRFARILMLAGALATPAALLAQLGGGGGGGGAASRALTLPLSGRTGEPGSVAPVQNSLPGGAQSVNTITSSVEVQGAYQGSVPSSQAAGAPFDLSLADAIRKGLQYNLGTVGYQNSIRQARGQRWVELANLMPQVSADTFVTDQQVDLAAFGFHFSFPGFSIPTVVGPFHYFDLRAHATQSIYNMTDRRNFRASEQNLRATELSAQDARDLVVLAVTGGYLSILSASARIDAARAQVAAAQATYQQAVDRHDAGVTARIDVTRSQVELQVQQQRLTSQETDFAKQKIQLGRVIGLPPGQDFNLTDPLVYTPLANLTLDQALLRAAANRADLKAAQAQVQAAELARKAATAERYPTADVAADYGVIGTSPTSSHGTFSVTGTLRVPIWQGGRVRGDIEQADAALQQRRAEYEDLRGRVDADVRQAFLDLTAAASQVTVSQSNRELAADTLAQARDRFAAGVADTIEVIQAQESVATAAQDYIASLFGHNLAKASLARAMGQAEQGIQQLLGRP
ncbi:MAG TPA: TolC family protein [Bryobacteraceae bacterium]|nr:TolC family protein [Bryobacteraceae bacterium]